MLCTVIYSFYQHRGRRGVFVFDTPVLQFSSFPYWATFNLPSAGLQLNVKHPEKSKQKTASLDLNISRDPWPPPCQVPHHYLCFKYGMWNIRKSWILVTCISDYIYDYSTGLQSLILVRTSTRPDRRQAERCSVQ